MNDQPDLCPFCEANGYGVCEASGWCPKGHHEIPASAQHAKALSDMLKSFKVKPREAA